jgi:hypothetical protein
MSIRYSASTSHVLQQVTRKRAFHTASSLFVKHHQKLFGVEVVLFKGKVESFTDFA